MTIDGYSQSGASANTLAIGNNANLKIELDGTNAGVVRGIVITAPDSVVKGLIINRFSVNGVFVYSPNATGNRIEGNYIGTDASGTQDLGNSSRGVDIENAPNNVVGGTSAAARNLISGNDGSGVGVDGAAGNRILRNSISDNGGLGINLFGGTENARLVTANDTDDPDTGANNLQNYPVITSATTFNEETTVEGTLNSTANDTFNLQFFGSLAADPSGFGEGETFAGQTNVTTNSGGNTTFSFTTSTPLSGGRQSPPPPPTP